MKPASQKAMARVRRLIRTARKNRRWSDVEKLAGAAERTMRDWLAGQRGRADLVEAVTKRLA